MSDVPVFFFWNGFYVQNCVHHNVYNTFRRKNMWLIDEYLYMAKSYLVRK